MQRAKGVRDVEKKNARLKEENERLIEQGKASGLADAAKVRELTSEAERLDSANRILTAKAESLARREKDLIAELEKAKNAAEEARIAEAAASAAKESAIAEAVAAAIASSKVDTAPVAAPEAVDTAALAAAQADLTTAQAELETLRATLETVQAELGTTKTELTASMEERERVENEMEERFGRLQTIAEKQIGKLQDENRSLKAATESMKAAYASDRLGGAERFHSLVALAPFGVFEADAEGNWTAANEAWAKISGLSVEESKGNGWKKRIHEADLASVEEAWKVAVSNGSVFARAFRMVTPDGTLRQVAARTAPVNGSGAASFLGVIEDMTERRRAEEAVKSSAVCLRSVVEAVMEGIVLLNQQGNIISWNRSAEAMFGYPESEAVGKAVLALFAPEEQAPLQDTLAQATREEALHTPHTRNVIGVRRDGVTFPVEIALSAWRSGEAGDAAAETFYTATIRDVSQFTQAEDMRREKEMAEEANRAKSQFMANMSHELRTPLNAIIGFSEILHDRTFGDLNNKQERYIDNILNSGRHLLQLINDILDLTKIEAGSVEMEYVAFPLAVAVGNVDSLTRALAAKKSLTMDVNLPADLPVLIADQAKLKQVLFNLISNAIKFTPEGGQVVVTAAAEHDGRTLHIAVQDTGIGINPDDQERIFREFEQIDNSYARSQQGTGLGLALARRVVEMHGGRIWVESAGEGQGSTFHFQIPFAPSDDVDADTAYLSAAAPSAPAANGANGTNGANGAHGANGTNGVHTAPTEPVVAEEAPAIPEPTVPAEQDNRPVILVVDDDQAASELLTHHLQAAGYVVARAFTAADAVSLARELSPAVITLDVQLPDREGWSVLEELKGDDATKGIAVLMVSIIEDRERAAALGAVECFVKPVLKESLLVAIGREALRWKNEKARAAEGVAVAAGGNASRRRGGRARG
jgi:PAS domain S-box-containing protein